MRITRIKMIIKSQKVNLTKSLTIQRKIKIENKDKSNKNTNDDKQQASSDDSNNDTANNEYESTSKTIMGKLKMLTVIMNVHKVRQFNQRNKTTSNKLTTTNNKVAINNHKITMII